MSQISFYKYFMGYIEVYFFGWKIIGDLAREVKGDRTAPKRSNSFKVWETYLIANKACSGALKALREAFREYEAYKNQVSNVKQD